MFFIFSFHFLFLLNYLTSMFVKYKLNMCVIYIMHYPCIVIIPSYIFDLGTTAIRYYIDDIAYYFFKKDMIDHYVIGGRFYNLFDLHNVDYDNIDNNDMSQTVLENSSEISEILNFYNHNVTHDISNIYHSVCIIDNDLNLYVGDNDYSFITTNRLYHDPFYDCVVTYDEFLDALKNNSEFNGTLIDVHR